MQRSAPAKKPASLDDDLVSQLASPINFTWNLSGQIIATSHDLTPNGGLVREIPLFQGNLGWWNIIIWPDLSNGYSRWWALKKATPLRDYGDFGYPCKIAPETNSEFTPENQFCWVRWIFLFGGGTRTPIFTTFLLFRKVVMGSPFLVMIVLYIQGKILWWILIPLIWIWLIVSELRVGRKTLGVANR